MALHLVSYRPQAGTAKGDNQIKGELGIDAYGIGYKLD